MTLQASKTFVLTVAFSSMLEYRAKHMIKLLGMDGTHLFFLRDLWTSQCGAMYETDGSGVASLYFYLYFSLNIGNKIEHVVTIHEEDRTDRKSVV